jgi:peptidylprolyl isomerase
VVSVKGTVKAPTLSVETKPLTVKETTTKVVTEGKGQTLAKDSVIRFNFVLMNGKDGKQIENSFVQGSGPAELDLAADIIPGLSKGLTGQKVGSRVLVAIPPADAFGAQGNAAAGVGPTDTVLFMMDLVSATPALTTATGAAVPPVAGLPTVKVTGAKAALITVPKTAPPAKLIVQPLIKGKGQAVQSGQTVKVNYTGVLWKNGKKFDASADHGGPTPFLIGAGKVIPGWDKGLVGQTIGSRMLMVVPPADGYGAKGGSGIGPNETLVFVIDLLAIR